MGNSSCAVESKHDCDLLEKPISLRAVVDVACVLTILGSATIVLSYFCSKEHRTWARYILVQLSISNMGQVLSNFVGSVANLDGSFAKAGKFSYDLFSPNRSVEEKLCTAQAFITISFSLSSMMWTISLAVYLYVVISSARGSSLFPGPRFSVCFAHCLCYGLPLLVTVWLLLSRRLGYAPYGTPGYCGLMTRVPFQERRREHQPSRDVYGEFFGYDVWLILTITLTLFFYMSTLCYLKHQASNCWLHS